MYPKLLTFLTLFSTLPVVLLAETGFVGDGADAPSESAVGAAVPPPFRTARPGDEALAAFREGRVHEGLSMVRSTAEGDPAVEAALIRASARFLADMRWFGSLREARPGMERRLDELVEAARGLDSAARYRVLEEAGLYYERIVFDSARALALYVEADGLGYDRSHRLGARAETILDRRPDFAPSVKGDDKNHPLK